MKGGKGGRNPLGEDTVHFMRYFHELPIERHVLSGSRCKRLFSDEMKENMSARNSRKSLKDWHPPSPVIKIGNDTEPEPENKKSEKIGKGENLERKTAILYMFENKLGSPEMKNWKSEKVIFMEALGIPKGSRRSVTLVLEASLARKDL